jgi:hypothetical protein
VSASQARPAASTAQLPVGAQLGHILMGAHLPAGWGPIHAVQHPEIDSGSLLLPVDGPRPGQYICSAMGSSAGAGDFIYWWARSYASVGLQYRSDAGGLSPAVVNLTIGAFDPGYAARTIALTAKLAGRCRAFKDRYLNRDPVATRTAVVPLLGDQNLYVVSVEREPGVKVTDQVLLARLGNDVVGVDANDAGGGGVRSVTVKGFAAWLISVLQARCGSCT